MFHSISGFLRFIYKIYVFDEAFSQPTFTCSKLTIETAEQGVKYVQS